MSDLDKYIAIVDSIKLPDIKSQPDADRAQRLMALRRQMIDRIYSVRQLSALKTRAHATLRMLEPKEGACSPAEEDIRGRAEEEQANMKYYDDMIGQHLLEREMFRGLLIEG